MPFLHIPDTCHFFVEAQKFIIPALSMFKAEDINVRIGFLSVRSENFLTILIPWLSSNEILNVLLQIPGLLEFDSKMCVSGVYAPLYQIVIEFTKWTK